MDAASGGQELERHGLAQHQVGGAIDFAHAAAAQQSDDAIAAAQQRAGDEAAFVDVGRRRDVRDRVAGGLGYSLCDGGVGATVRLVRFYSCGAANLGRSRLSARPEPAAGPKAPRGLKPALLPGPRPPAMAPTIRNGSAPDATASGSGASGGSWDRSSSQAKNRTNGRRCCVTWSRIVPRSIG